MRTVQIKSNIYSVYIYIYIYIYIEIEIEIEIEMEAIAHHLARYFIGIACLSCRRVL